jgi:hypothetical protein
VGADTVDEGDRGIKKCSSARLVSEYHTSYYMSAACPRRYVPGARTEENEGGKRRGVWVASRCAKTAACAPRAQPRRARDWSLCLVKDDAGASGVRASPVPIFHLFMEPLKR